MRKKMMDRRVLRVAGGLVLLIPGACLVGAENGTVTPQRAFLDRYCVTCHNQRAKTAGLMLDKLDIANVGVDAKTWEEAVRKLRGSLMPPPGARQPEPGERKAFVSSLENSLDEAAAKSPNPGSVALHRLNRTEYANEIESILGVRLDVNNILPADDTADGFDNIANVLKVSPSFLEQYISAARLATAKAIGNPTAAPVSATLRPTPGADQSIHVEGLPPGTRGGFVSEYTFPADGEYEFTVNGLANAFYMQGMEYWHRVILTIDGAKVFESHVGGEDDMKLIDQRQAPAVAAIRKRFEKIRVPVTAGPHQVGVTFVSRGMAESDNTLQSFVPGAGIDRLPRTSGVDLTGPFHTTGISDTPSRSRIFVCRPSDPREELPCASRILSQIARQAFRRAVTASDLASPLAFFKDGRQRGSFDAGIQNALTAILSSPKFLYRAEEPPAEAKPGSIYRISDLELASRLSYFLWTEHPDEKLIDLAMDAKLSDPAVLEQQVRRMLADSRSQALVTNFDYQWLNMKGILEMDPDPALFPGFDANLRAAFLEELQLFGQSIISEDRNVVDLLTANYTFVNERLARHYGIPNVTGNQFRRVTLTDPNRWGLLGKGGVLMATSYGNRTAPVLRGAYILERILGTPPSPPPANVGALPDAKAGAKGQTVRELMEQHRKNPSCNACHGIMDPLGFALENFDAVGEWRTVDRYAGTTIDASGKLADGTPVNAPADLREALAKNSPQFVQTFAEKLMTYALGRQLKYYDVPVIRKIVRDAALNQNRFSSVVMGIVKSAPFQKREADDPERGTKAVPPALARLANGEDNNVHH
jgi:hypothetical protein